MVQTWLAQHLNPAVGAVGTALFCKTGSLTGVGVYQPTGKQVCSSFLLVFVSFEENMTAN